MNFLTFSAAQTNIFPAANSKYGGQLMTEYNVRSRETVGTHPSIKYTVGLSYVHSADDFAVRILSDDSGTPISFSTLEILPGRGVINGHFVETLGSMSVDLLEANNTLKLNARAPLKGKLAVGIRIFYATEQTVADTIVVENEDKMYAGVQLVVLPEAEFITPIESPEDQSRVTAHLRLATFTFNNNRISNIKNCDSEKIRCISADRIGDIDQMLSDTYVRKTGLNPKKLYTFAGKGTDPATGYDTWEDSTDSLIIWDATPQRTNQRPGYSQAGFTVIDSKAYLVAPHKQIDSMKDAEGHPEYYAPRLIEMPTAGYGENSTGVVDRKYTQYIKNLYNELDTFRVTKNGKQVLYINSLDDVSNLPAINPQWSVGDYILVNMDYTAEDVAEATRAPSTLYVVLPGEVTSILFLTQVQNSSVIPSSLSGACLGRLDLDSADRDPVPNTTDPALYPTFYSEGDGTRGIPNSDYFLATYRNGSDVTYYYYKVNTAGPRGYSSYVPLTGAIPLAQETVIGGFYNVSTEYADAGYVYRDEYGRLKLVDYQLLRSGTLAYQLGEDITLPTGITTEEVQNYLDEYVNSRIAFPSAGISTSRPSVINIYITLPSESSASTITISGIDSRFNTAVYLHIQGEATNTTTINIVDCQKIRIDNNISGTPVINVIRSNIYYDPYIFNYVRQCTRSDGFTGFEDIKLWYLQFDTDTDPKLVVDNMTVSELDAPVIPEDISYWNVTEANDNHYFVALNSITFASDGTIIKCVLAVANDSTNNVDPGETIVVGSFDLPQGSGLSYPVTCLNKQLKVSGTFVSAYYADSTWYTTNTSFTALTAAYDPYDTSLTASGNIAFHTVTTLVDADIEATSIPAWESDTYHLFFGGCIS